MEILKTQTGTSSQAIENPRDNSPNRMSVMTASASNPTAEQQEL
jgi:hypothetical protein